MDYYSVLAETYGEDTKEETYRLLPHVEFVCPVLVRPIPPKIKTPQGDIDEIPGKKVDFDYDHLLNKQKEGSRILLQGRPGSGKSRLMKQISCDLANNNRNGPNRKFVISIKLRELCDEKFDEFQKNPRKCLLDICTTGGNLSDEAKETLLKKFDHHGSNIIFLFDGFDEYNPKDKRTDLIRKIFKNRVTSFKKSTVIMSSRPSATYEFQGENSIENVEIFGFTTPEVLKYMQNAEKYLAPVNGKEKISTLTKHLEKNPAIMNVCYLPLYCSMLVQLFKREDDVEKLPKIESKFYECFTLSTWNCYVKKRRDNRSDAGRELSKFIKLKQEGDFKEICKVAYDKLRDFKQDFTADDFSAKQDFGLLVEQIVVPVGVGEVQSYSFIHLTFQEYLTAIYIAWYLEESEQDAIVTEHCSDKAFLVVWQFLFGILEPYSDELFNKIQRATPDEHMLHIRCAYESQNPTACAKVLVVNENSLELVNIRPSDLPCLTYVLENIDTPIAECKLMFLNCNFGEKDAQTFLKGVGHHQLSLRVQYVNAFYCFIMMSHHFIIL